MPKRFGANVQPEDRTSLGPSVAALVAIVCVCVGVGIGIVGADKAGTPFDHRVLTSQSYWHNIVRHPMLFLVTEVITRLLNRPISCLAISAGMLFLGLRWRYLRAPAEAAGLITIACYLATVVFHDRFLRYGTDFHWSSFPIMQVQVGFAVWPFLVCCAIMLFPRVLVIVVVLLGALAVTDVVFVEVYFGYAWLTDVLGSAALGLAFAFIALSAFLTAVRKDWVSR